MLSNQAKSHSLSQLKIAAAKDEKTMRPVFHQVKAAEAALDELLRSEYLAEHFREIWLEVRDMSYSLGDSVWFEGLLDGKKQEELAP